MFIEAIALLRLVASCEQKLILYVIHFLNVLHHSKPALLFFLHDY